MSNEPVTGASIVTQIQAELQKAKISEVRKTVKTEIQEYLKLKTAAENALTKIVETLTVAGLDATEIRKLFE